MLKRLIIFSGSLVLFLLGTSQASAANFISVSGNGAHSQNTVRVVNKNHNTIVQTNKNTTTNNVHVSNNTGGNSSSFNTGGFNTISTGSAGSSVHIENTGNSNFIGSLPCNSCNDHNQVVVHGNGFGSRSFVDVLNKGGTNIFQDNINRVKTNVNVHNNTGANNFFGNTGSGCSFVLHHHGFPCHSQNHGGSQSHTGNSFSDVVIQNHGSFNQIGGF